MARKYLKFDLDCFVETNKSIKWCPYPACQRAVNLPESERQMWEDSSLVPPVSHAVDCGGGHFFWSLFHQPLLMKTVLKARPF